MSRNSGIERYSVERWSKYHDLQKIKGFGPSVAVELAALLRKRFGKWYSVETITTYGLDNPYMTDDARQVMLNDRQRIDGFRVRGKR